MKNLVASKLGVVSLVTIGLLSGPVLAAQGVQAGQDMSSLKNRVSHLEATLESISQQDGRPAQQNGSWNQFIKVSGGANVDMKLIGSIGNNIEQTSTDQATTAGRFTGEQINRFAVNDAYLNFDADINEWFDARVGLSFDTLSNTFYNVGRSDLGTNSAFHVDQAYITYANLDKEPYYLRAGVQYFDYGTYQLHPITKSFTQVLTEVNDVGVQVGMIDNNGWNVSLFAVDTPFNHYDDNENIAANVENRTSLNFGASVGYTHQENQDFSYHGKVGYLSNLVSLNSYSRGRTGGSPVNGNYSEAVHGMSLDLGIDSGPFALNASYTGALKSFSDLDVQEQIGVNARPAAADINASYNFKYMDNRDNKITIGYDRSWEASSFGLPKDRYYAEYMLGLYKNTDVFLRWDHDNDYSSNFATAPDSDGDVFDASGKNYNVVTARLAVNFG